MRESTGPGWQQASDLAAENLLATAQSLEQVPDAVRIIECRPQTPVLTKVRRSLGSPPRKEEPPQTPERRTHADEGTGA